MESRITSNMKETMRGNIRQQLIVAGENPYPQDGHKTHTNAEALALTGGEQTQIAGRIMGIRGHGKLRFMDVVDDTGKLQVVFKADKLPDDWERLDTIQKGDFIRTSGTRFATKAGEESVLVTGYELISKALQDLPDTWQGITDPETRYRKRSLDMLINPEVKNILKLRSVITQSVRETLLDTGFIEVDTPVLQPLYGGANARPFTTKIWAWDNMEMYLRISPELYLKYYIMGGMDKVFEIARNFRNEGVDKTHNPEFTMMECYAAYWDYHDMMDLTEVIYRNATLAATGATTVNYQGTELDFGRRWERLTMYEGINKYLGVDVTKMTDSEIKEQLTRHNLEYKGAWVRGLGIAKLSEAIEQYLIQPTFLTDMPRETTSLCKPHRNHSELIERFEPYINGWEVGNAYTELNDPVLQRQFWEEERQEEDDAHPLDETFIEAMEHGMPPTGGLGLGIDRMVMLLTNQTKIRDVIAFPTMKRI